MLDTLNLFKLSLETIGIPNSKFYKSIVNYQNEYGLCEFCQGQIKPVMDRFLSTIPASLETAKEEHQIMRTKLSQMISQYEGFIFSKSKDSIQHTVLKKNLEDSLAQATIANDKDRFSKNIKAENDKIKSISDDNLSMRQSLKSARVLQTKLTDIVFQQKPTPQTVTALLKSIDSYYNGDYSKLTQDFDNTLLRIQGKI